MKKLTVLVLVFLTASCSKSISTTVQQDQTRNSVTPGIAVCTLTTPMSDMFWNIIVSRDSYNRISSIKRYIKFPFYFASNEEREQAARDFNNWAYDYSLNVIQSKELRLNNDPYLLFYNSYPEDKILTKEKTRQFYEYDLYYTFEDEKLYYVSIRDTDYDVMRSIYNFNTFTAFQYFLKEEWVYLKPELTTSASEYINKIMEDYKIFEYLDGTTYNINVTCSDFE